MASDADLLLPEGTCLVHAGMPKTGTTALQVSLHHRRDELGGYGVTYASAGERHPMRAILAILDRYTKVGQAPPDMAQWHRIVREANEAEGRVIVSSETFSDGDDDKVAKAVEAFGLSRVHVVLTLRPVLRVLPSAWQQQLQNRMRLSYEDWLDAMFNKPPYIEPTPTFWKRYIQERQVRRWVEIVGADHVTLVVAQEGDRELLPRTFESFLGLPAGMLDPVPGRTNRSLTLGEAELVRLLNHEFKRRWTSESYARLVRGGVVKELARNPPPAGAAKAVTPKWALERAAEVDARAARAIESYGVRVIGDFSAFGQVPDDLVRAAADAPSEPPAVSAESAMQAVIGAIQASKAADKAGKPAKRPGSGGTKPHPAAGRAAGEAAREQAASGHADGRVRSLVSRGRRAMRGSK